MNVQDKGRGIEELMRNALELITGMGDIALEYYGRGRPGVKFDESLVTEAELRLKGKFDEKLGEIYPEHRLFDDGASQDTEYSHDEKRYVWIFDALDGVANFQGGIPIWGMSLALLENNWPVLGIFHMPATGDVFCAAAGGAGLWNGRRVPDLERSSIDDESVLLINSRFHRRYRSSFPGKILNLGCSGAHICYVATGRAEGSVIFNESYQGLAAAFVIGEACGVGLYRMDGRGFSYSEYPDAARVEESMLVAPKELAGEIWNYLERLP
ncbi:MAG TPA: inositol monophosphatase [Desulfobacteraceae bacterium]|jgi:myo-inositol-1(or 4)-monophosphatase|nr:inositol monophosphatase [Desulfobacteraceae bacterium]